MTDSTVDDPCDEHDWQPSDVVLLSDPPQREYECVSCGETRSEFVDHLGGWVETTLDVADAEFGRL